MTKINYPVELFQKTEIKNNLMKKFFHNLIKHSFLHITIISTTGLLFSIYVIIGLNKNDVSLKNRTEKNLKMIIDTSIHDTGVGGAYKPDVIDAPVNYFDYYIEQGESIYSIAKKFGVDDVTLININDIKIAALVRQGMKIIIPNQNGIFEKIRKESDVDSVVKKYNLDKEDVLRVNLNNISGVIDNGKIFLPGVKVDSITRQLMLGEYFIRPAYGRITSYFGYRRDPWTGKRNFHQGIDIANRNGGFIYAAAPGRIIYNGWSWLYGNNIKIIHTSGYVTFYGHLASINVHNGQWVQSGVAIGRMGSTGRSTGTHVHFEVRQHGRVINPLRVTILR